MQKNRIHIINFRPRRYEIREPLPPERIYVEAEYVEEEYVE